MHHYRAVSYAPRGIIYTPRVVICDIYRFPCPGKMFYSNGPEAFFTKVFTISAKKKVEQTIFDFISTENYFHISCSTE